LKELVDEHFPKAKRIRLVLDNLSTHTPGALYQTFSPEEARRITRKLAIHYVPKNGSWLNMVEIEFSVLSNHCLDDRDGNMDLIPEKIGYLEVERNEKKATVKWRFALVDARTKFQRLYTHN
jgi:transposase